MEGRCIIGRIFFEGQMKHSGREIISLDNKVFWKGNFCSDKHISKEMFSTEVFLNDLQNNINPSFECLKWTSD